MTNKLTKPRLTLAQIKKKNHWFWKFMQAYVDDLAELLVMSFPEASFLYARMTVEIALDSGAFRLLVARDGPDQYGVLIWDEKKLEYVPVPFPIGTRVRELKMLNPPVRDNTRMTRS